MVQKTRAARRNVLRSFPFVDSGSVNDVFMEQAKIEPLTGPNAKPVKYPWRQCTKKAIKEGTSRSPNEGIAQRKSKTNGNETRWDGNFARSKKVSSPSKAKVSSKETVRTKKVSRPSKAKVSSKGTAKKQINQVEQNGILSLVDRLCQDPIVTSFIVSDETTGAPPQSVFCKLSTCYQPEVHFCGKEEEDGGYENIWNAPQGCLTPTSSLCEEEHEETQRARARLFHDLRQMDENLDSSDSDDPEENDSTEANSGLDL
mmetsp:Transcript_10511/g.17140  ORF Transcript_10511/g.17140 Transcript_10511/m.17140 type:complete len:258 (-) Transcript_10511:276-1049(-)